MNNQRQKNVILQIDDMNIIPYQSGVQLKLNGGDINSTRLNNAFQQLVNNDLFVENSLKDNDYEIGPKTLSEDEIGEQLDGTKWYDITESTFKINHKIDNGQIGSENIVRTNVTDRANFIKKFGKYLIAGTDNGIFCSTDGIQFSKIDDMNGLDAWEDDSNMFIVSDSGVFEIIETSDTDKTMTPFQLNENEINVPKCIYYDKEGRKIYVGTTDGKVYSASYISKDTKIRFVSSYSFNEKMYEQSDILEINPGDVNDIVCLEQKDSSGNVIKSITSDNFIIVSTDNGIYRSRKRTCLEGLSKKIANYKINGSAVQEGQTFFSSQSMVMRMEDDGSFVTIAYGIGNIAGMRESSDGVVRVFGDGHVWKLFENGDSVQEVVSSESIRGITDLDVIGETMVFSSRFGIFAISGNTVCGGLLRGVNVRQLCVPKNGVDGVMYALTEDGVVYQISGFAIGGGTISGNLTKLTSPDGHSASRIIPMEDVSNRVYVQFMSEETETFGLYWCAYVNTTQSQVEDAFHLVTFTLNGEECDDFKCMNFMNGRGITSGGIVSFDDGSQDIYQSKSNVISEFPKSAINNDDTKSISMYTYDGKRYAIVIDNVIYSYAGSSQSMIYSRISGDKAKYNRITRIGNNSFLVGCENGLFAIRYLKNTIPTPYSVCSQSELRNTHRLIYNEDVENVPKYILLTENNIMKSDDYRKWEDFISLDKSSEYYGENIVFDLVVQDRYHYCFGWTEGVCNTTYSYQVIDDFEHYDEGDLNTLYESLETTIDENIENFVNGDHVNEYHNSESTVTLLNNKMMVDFSNISSDGTWPTVSVEDSRIAIENDFVKSVDFGNFGDGKVRVLLENFLLSSESVTFTYILKTWYSGIRELYVYIPTTNTYYLPHNTGCPDCSLYSEEIQRKNLLKFGSERANVDGDINSHCSKFQIELDNTTFNIDEVLEIHANGNSLPLGIYKDSDSVDREGQQANMFHSFILPTVLVKQSINNLDEVSQSEEENHKFKFACFGTDSQAVKIQFYDSTAFEQRQIFTVVFNANGGQGSMDNMIVPYDTDKAKRLTTNMFTYNNGQKSFIGWSCYPSPSTWSDVQFSNRAYIGISYLPQDIRATLKAGGRVNLYAVWANYTLDSDSSTFTLKSTNEEFYIDSVTIDPTTRFGDNVVISYGD